MSLFLSKLRGIRVFIVGNPSVRGFNGGFNLMRVLITSCNYKILNMNTLLMKTTNTVKYSTNDKSMALIIHYFEQGSSKMLKCNNEAFRIININGNKRTFQELNANISSYMKMGWMILTNSMNGIFHDIMDHRDNDNVFKLGDYIMYNGQTLIPHLMMDDSLEDRPWSIYYNRKILKIKDITSRCNSRRSYDLKNGFLNTVQLIEHCENFKQRSCNVEGFLEGFNGEVFKIYPSNTLLNQTFKKVNIMYIEDYLSYPTIMNNILLILNGSLNIDSDMIYCLCHLVRKNLHILDIGGGNINTVLNQGYKKIEIKKIKIMSS